jgi:hypothetical protein
MPGPTIEEIIQKLGTRGTLNDRRLDLARRISERMVQDPDFLRAVERVLSDYTPELEAVRPREAERESFGWGPTREPGEPEEAAHDAAALTGVAFMVAPVIAPPAPGQ